MNKLGQAISGTRSFVGEVQVELKKCTWPTRTELMESTVVVIVSIAILGAVVSLSDVILNVLLRAIMR
ncbi:MAG: preprotein translocase subunit SecE [Kiritimatiellae bacterium]|nr:preprotein translocase subunit SecE [Kiritimatiellia bacterium]